MFGLIRKRKRLKSKFTESNIEEIKKHFREKNNNNTPFFEEEIQPPRLIFYDTKKITPGYYDFKIDDVLFQNCWVEPTYSIETSKIKYVSGSYSAIIIK
jgi:hypothetical protein